VSEFHLNEEVITRYLSVEHTLATENIHEKVVEIVDSARAEVRKVMHRSLKGGIDMSSAVDFEWDEARQGYVIGFRDEGKMAEYLAAKEAREGAFFQPALRSILGI
jgi:hypothetical protein